MRETVEVKSDAPRFAIFRGRDGQTFDKVSNMYLDPMSPVEAEGFPKLMEAGYEDGHETKLLFAVPGMSLTYVWFKSGVPLPRHSHNCDCLYYIIAGSLNIGSEVLGQGDGFFVGADVPYAYVPGDNGVEVLEFRTADTFSMKFLADNPAFWQHAIAEASRRREAWALEQRPTSCLEQISPSV